MMSQRGKKGYLETIKPRYKQSTKAEKHQILDEFVNPTGCHRKYEIRVLNKWVRRKRSNKPRPKNICQGEVVLALERIWEICGRICSTRIHPFFPEMVRVLEPNNDLQLSTEVKKLLLSMSRSSIDRCLRSAYQECPHGVSATKPGTFSRNLFLCGVILPGMKKGLVSLKLIP